PNGSLIGTVACGEVHAVREGNELRRIGRRRSHAGNVERNRSRHRPVARPGLAHKIILRHGKDDALFERDETAYSLEWRAMERDRSGGGAIGGSQLVVRRGEEEVRTAPPRRKKGRPRNVDRNDGPRRSSVALPDGGAAAAGNKEKPACHDSEAARLDVLAASNEDRS